MECNKPSGTVESNAWESELSKRLEQAKFDALAEFAAGAGHEINNPLAVISGRAQLLLATERDDDRRSELSRIIAQARRAHEMIADLRLLGRPPKLQPKRLDLVALIDQFVKEFTHFLASESKRTANASKVTLDWQSPTLPLFLCLDADVTLTILHAVTKNAMESILRTWSELSGDSDAIPEVEPTRDSAETTGQGPWTRIRLSLSQETVLQQEAVVRLDISDWGESIPSEVREHLFDPFYSGRQSGRGLGFGLSKAKRLMDRMGGTLSVHTTSTVAPNFCGAGAKRTPHHQITFRLEWPMRES